MVLDTPDAIHQTSRPRDPMTITIDTSRPSSFVDAGIDVDVIVNDAGTSIRGTATAMWDATNGRMSVSWASCPDMWLSDALLDYASDVATAISGLLPPQNA